MKLHTYNIVTFGCQMNVNESDWLERSLQCLGFTPASEEDAQVHIINTCSVRAKPVQKVYSLLGTLEKLTGHDPNVFAVVGGCVAQQLGKKFFQRFRQVRLVYGPDGTLNAPEAIGRLCAEKGLRLSLLDFSEEYSDKEALLGGADVKPSAFVDIMQGCNNFCSYCIVPFTRGPQKSRPTASILAECETLASQGTREITLLGQNVNAYAQDKPEWNTSFADLLYKVSAVSGIERLRFMTSHPKDIAPEVITAFAELDNLCPRVHLPLQSGSNKILERMGRKYTVERYLDVVAGLRKARPDMEFSTDIIVGFPGETEDDFEETMQVMQQVDFMESYSFCYSSRPGTKAAQFLEKVPVAVARERLSRLQAWQTNRREQVLKQRVGKTINLLVEGASRCKNGWQGRDPYGHLVNVRSQTAGIGSVLPVTIVEAKRRSLVGQEV